MWLTDESIKFKHDLLLSQNIELPFPSFSNFCYNLIIPGPVYGCVFNGCFISMWYVLLEGIKGFYKGSSVDGMLAERDNSVAQSAQCKFLRSILAPKWLLTTMCSSAVMPVCITLWYTKQQPNTNDRSVWPSRASAQTGDVPSTWQFPAQARLQSLLCCRSRHLTSGEHSIGILHYPYTRHRMYSRTVCPKQKLIS